MNADVALTLAFVLLAVAASLGTSAIVRALRMRRGGPADFHVDESANDRRWLP